MNLRDLQLWLNAKGAKLTVDGKPGPATRAAIIDTFTNTKAEAISAAEMTAIANRLGGTYAQLRAVGQVEGGGAGWDNAGRLKVLYERHYAWRRIRVLIPFLSNPSPGGYTIDADRDGINDSWEKVADMAMRNPLVAFESASWGRFQVMGAHAKALGYTNALEMVWRLSIAEVEHFELLARYIEVNGLRRAFQTISTNPEDNRAFARGYNGPAYAKGDYHTKIARAMR